jgi:hypothetical protein
MDLFKRNSKYWRFVIVKSNAIHKYMGYNVVVIQKQLMCSALLIKEMSRKTGTPLIHSTRCIKKAVLLPESNDVDHISEVLNSLDRKSK